jgi:hypothetical protein
LVAALEDTEAVMADRAKPLGSRNGAGFKPGAILGAVFLSLVLVLLFGLVSHAHF